MLTTIFILKKRILFIRVIAAIELTYLIKHDANIRAGVPQGFRLGPERFMYYTSDILRSPNTRLAIYTDDTISNTSSNTGGLICRLLLRSVDNIRDWATRWRLSINAIKCEAIRFSQKWNLPPTNIVVQHERLRGNTRQTTSLLYSTRGKHFNEAISNFLWRKSSVTLKIKKLIFTLFLRQIFIYGALTWFSACPTQ